MTLTRNSARQCSTSCVAKTTTSEAPSIDFATAATFVGSATSIVGHSIKPFAPPSSAALSSFGLAIGDISGGLAGGSGGGSCDSSDASTGAGDEGFEAIRAGTSISTGDGVVTATPSDA